MTEIMSIVANGLQVGMECRDLIAEKYQEVFWVMEIFSFMNIQFIQWWYLCGMYISQNSSNSKIKLGEFYSVYIIFQYTSF